MKKKLFIFSNESIYLQNGKFFCDNLDLKTTPEGLNKRFEINLFGRKSTKQRTHEIKLKKVKAFNNIFSYITAVIKSTSKDEEAKYFVISINPYTFIICVLLRLLRKKPIVYLRSDGYGEYKSILGSVGPLIYHLMFTFVSLISNLISCREYILKGKKGKIVNPSQLDSVWFRKTKTPDIKNFKLLYVGRIRVEKGIFFLADLIKNKRNIALNIVGAEKHTSHKINQSNVKIHLAQNNKSKLIKFYDDHNIFVLPSYTEGHPMVILEALARRRPVIIFDEIRHIIGNKKGIFVARRNFLSFFEILNHIQKNYKTIQKEMVKNKLVTNKEFIEKLIKSIEYY